MGTLVPRLVSNLLDHLCRLYICLQAGLVQGQRQKWSKCWGGHSDLVCLVLLLSLRSAKGQRCLAQAGKCVAVASRRGLPQQEGTLW